MAIYDAFGNLISPSASGGIADGSVTPQKTDFMALVGTPSGNLFDPAQSYPTLGNTPTAAGGFVENANGARMASGMIPVSAGIGYFISVEKLIDYLGGSYFYVALYDAERAYLGKVVFDPATRDYAAAYTFASFTPTVDGYMQLLYTPANVENIMLTVGDSYVPYEPYGETYTLDIAEQYKAGFRTNILPQEDEYREIIPFVDLPFADDGSIATVSAEHTQNSERTLKLATTSTEYVAVDFGDIKLPTGGKNFGFWMWCDGKTVGAKGTATDDRRGSIRFTIGNYSVERSGIYLNAGMHYYVIPLDRIGSQVIGDLKIEIKSGTGAEVAFYLDSIQFGYRVTPHIIFSFDAPPKGMDATARSIFTEYGIPMPFQTIIRENGAASPSYDSQQDALLHFELMAEGAEYAIYSQYHGDYHTTGQPTDYDTDYDAWYKHFVEAYKTNNVYGIFGPTFLNANFHLWGDAYCRAGRDAGFLGVRGDRVQLHTEGAAAAEKALFSNFDDEYRHVTPMFLYQAVADSTQEALVKTLIDRAIELGQNILIASHAITTEEEAATTMYTGEVFMANILAYVREKIDAGEMVATTWAGYVKDVRPDLYAAWLDRKSRAEYKFLMDKTFGSAPAE